MIKQYLLLFLFVTCLAATAFTDTPQPNMPALRKQLIEAIDRKKTTDSLYLSLGLIKQPSALITGYMGALEALKAKHAWNPYYKIKYLSNSENTFKLAVAQEPHNIEIRFLRYSVEHNVPGFLGYNKNLTADKLEMIKQIELKNYPYADKDLIISTITFLLESKQCSSGENELLHKQLAALK